MEKKNKIFVISLIVLILAVVGVAIYIICNNKKEENLDAKKFQNEYMELNGKEIYGFKYVEVDISENNTVKYVNEEEVVELLENGSGIIYFGFATCPWCRSLVTTLTKVAEEKKETIYYLDISNIRSKFEIKDGKLNKVSEGTKGYYEILRVLDNELEQYYLTENDKKYDTNEKRLYAPTLVAVKDGEIKSMHVDTVESQKSGFDKLTDEQKAELRKIIEDLMDSKNYEICTQDRC